VAATGAANGQKGVESASRTGLGAYQVKFDRNVSTCAVQASVTSIDTAEPPKGHTIRVWTNPGDPTIVNVGTVNAGGNDADTPFHVSALC
ncbi:MAG: hypothetical protein RLN63_02990, partial [Miltoncostaeaceae bacterium]